MENRKLPVGIESFKEIRQEGFYYVDKTGLISDLLNNWGKVNLFTRPRRFGKSLNMSMLKSFFEIGTDPTLFDGLRISKEKSLCEEYMGKYPVISISLKGVDGFSYETARGMLWGIIQKELRRVQYFVKDNRLSQIDKDAVMGLYNSEVSDDVIQKSLSLLTELLYKYYGQKVILLIDEYDVPLDKASLHGYYEEMVSLIRGFLGDALKTNEFLHFAVLTGCLRVSKESIFTGLNNLLVHSISESGFDEYFGFTDSEVRQMLKAYGVEDHYKETKEWYDGYRFGNQDVYCPWDVINYCYALNADKDAKPKSYWLNTSGNDMVKNLIVKTTDGTVRTEIEDLIAGNTVFKTLNEQLTYADLNNSDERETDILWSVLYMTGYLTTTGMPAGNRYELRIPNKEIRQIFTQEVLQWFKNKVKIEKGKLTSLYKAFETGDTKTITEYLNEQLLYTVSYYDAYESFYHGFLLALLNTSAVWSVSSNAESGRGRSDIIVRREDCRVGFVVEVKDTKDERKLDEASQNAIKLIEEKDYTAPLRRFRVKEIWSYGIAFCDKECKVVAKRVL